MRTLGLPLARWHSTTASVSHTTTLSPANTHTTSFTGHPPGDNAHLPDQLLPPFFLHPTMPAATSEEIVALSSTTVVVHPLVLLSVVDHAARVARGTKRRVVGILLGQNDGKKINVANSFAGQFLSFSQVGRARTGCGWNRSLVSIDRLARQDSLVSSSEEHTSTPASLPQTRSSSAQS